MLYKSDAYLWKCDGLPPVDIEKLTIRGVDFVDCRSRQESINNLYTAAFSCHFVSSALFGIMLDYSGPKICSLTGLTVAAVGWLLLGFSTKSCQMYIPAFMFIGMSADPCFLPLLSICNLFPRNTSTMMALMGATRSCSFAVPVIMSIIYMSPVYTNTEFHKFCIGYVGLGIGVCVIIAIVFIPFEPFEGEEAELIDNAEDADTPVTKKASSYEQVLADTATFNTPGSPAAVDDEETRLGVKKTEPHKTKSAVGIVVDNRKSFKETLMSWEFLLIVPFFCLCLIRNEFYTKNNKQQLVDSSGDTTILSMFRIMNILSATPGPIFGSLCDKIGCLWVILILNIDGILLYAFVIPDSNVTKGCSCFFFFIYCSFVLSNLYVYVAATLPKPHFGKLTGIASAVGGLFCLSSLWLTKMSLETFADMDPYNFAPANSIMLGFGLINCGLWYIMWRIQKSRLPIGKYLMDVAVGPMPRAMPNEEDMADGKDEVVRRRSIEPQLA